MTALTERTLGQLERIEALLREQTSYTEATIAEPASHLAEAGGKRLRPLLTLIASQLGSGTNERVERAAVAVELTHLATLYHDDVMDSTALRRGAPAAQLVWGNTVAILTGDLLFARASQLIASLGAEAVAIHAATYERLVLGQLHETIGPGEERPIDHYLQVLADKTGSLIATSARYGAMFAGAPDGATAAITRFGEKAGVAFQLADDVIDIVSDSEVTGKVPGTDLREGVDTMPILLLREREQEGRLDGPGREILELLDAGIDEESDLAAVVAKIRNHEVVGQARQLARDWANGAVAELTEVTNLEVKETLGRFAHQLVDRIS